MKNDRIVKCLILLATLFYSCRAQTDFDTNIEVTSDLELFEGVGALKDLLNGVEIIALGENTHGLGEVFSTKVELVKYLHLELDFDVLLIESGFGDGALAWEKLDSLTSDEYTSVFSSNFYYNSIEIVSLVEFVKSMNGNLKLRGFDCQPQQNYLIRRMMEIMEPVDSTFASSVPQEMRSFNNIYQSENDKDTLAFITYRDRFIKFINAYDSLLTFRRQGIIDSGTTLEEIRAIKKSNQIFRSTYGLVEVGDMMGWPESYNLRDKSMFEVVKWYKENNPSSKIIIWAQNSHIENKPKPNNPVKWMGHHLKDMYGDKYYSIGAIVYAGRSLNYNGDFEFEHSSTEYLAYHLNQFEKERFMLNLRAYPRSDFISELHLGMESNGNVAEFVAKDRFDGLLFLSHSDVPTLLNKN